MSPQPEKRENRQPVEFASHVSGKPGSRIPRRLKAKHLSEPTKRYIVERFEVLQSHDDVAREMEFPGLSGKTVSEVVDLFNVRRTVQSERRAAPLAFRRAW